MVISQPYSFFKDIRFWIALLFIIRLYGITLPPLEVGHNWRQTDVTMPARNFLDVDNNIFYPRIDIAGAKSGIAGMEFPVFNYLIYICAKIFGYQHWYGRLINLIVSSFGLFFFFKLLKKYFKSDTAFYATIILGVSVCFQFSRKIMPDTFAMSFLIAGLYFGTNYFDKKTSQKMLKLTLFVLLVAIGTLSKISTGFILIFFLLFIFDKKIKLQRKTVFVAAGLLAIFPTIWWHFYWIPLLIQKYDCNHFFLGVSFAEGFEEIAERIPQTLKRFYDTPLKFIGFAAFLLGLFYAYTRKNKIILLVLFLGFFSFLIFIIKAGDNFPHHNYYVIPFVPVMAMLAGFGLANLKNKILAVLFLIAIGVEGIGNQISDFKIRDNEKFLITIENELDEVSQRDELILINCENYPTPMYFAHRKGWVDFNYNIQNPAFVDSLAEEGLKHILILKKSFGTPIDLPYAKLIDNKDYCFYSIK